MLSSLAYVNFWLLYRRTLIDGAGPAAGLSMADYSDILWLYITGHDRPP